MILDRIIDPRDNLEKARRCELEHYARANGVGEIDPNMPAQLMRRILRAKGLTQIAVPNRPLGAVNARPLLPDPTQAARGEADGATASEAVAEIAAEDDLARQWKLNSSPLPKGSLVSSPLPKGSLVSSPLPKGARDYGTAEKSIEDMSFAELRAACKARGVRVARTDKASDLRGKLSGQDTA